MTRSSQADWLFLCCGLVIVGLLLLVTGYEVDAARVRTLGSGVAAGGAVLVLWAWAVWR